MGKKMCSVSRNISTGYVISISSPKNSGYGYDVQYLDISYLVISHDMGCDITTYRDISCDITPDHLETQVNTNSTKTHHLVVVYTCFFGCLCPRLGLPSVWYVLSSFCCPSAGHTIGLTVPPANSNLVPSRLGLLPERMFVLFHFSIFFFFLSVFFFFIPGTWYSLVRISCEVPDIYIMLLT